MTAKPAPGTGQDAPADMFDIIHAQILRFYPALVTELGGDPLALLAAAGIDASVPDSEEGRATYRQVVALLEQTAAALGLADFGMRLARHQGGYRVFGPLGLLMRNSRTFGEALDFVRTHTHAHSPASRIWRRRFPAEGMVFMGHDILLDRLRPTAQSIEQTLLLGHLAAIDITGGHVRARRVHLRHRAQAPPRVYRRHFGCEVRFEQQEDGLFFSEHDLARPIVDADAHAYLRIARHIETEYAEARTPLHAHVRNAILPLLGTEACTNDAVAAALTLHPRTLHRRLTAEGTSFHRIKDEVRRDVMLYYLRQTGFDLARISERLGFAEQSVLSRRCRSWFGAAPSAVRARLREALSETVKPAASPAAHTPPRKA